MPHTSFVELETGDQFYFETAYDAFKYAKVQERHLRNSVAYVAISQGTFEEEQIDLDKATQVTVYRGQQLRLMIRALDDTTSWIRTQLEESRNAKEEQDKDS